MLTVMEQKLDNSISLTGCRWQLRESDERLTAAIMQQHELPEILARILAARGIALENVPGFLQPSLKTSLPDPSHLLDMDKAAERIADAVTCDEKIAIFGDYDVDGATSSALLMRYLRALGNEPIVYIPDRMKEGYGPNTAALLSLKERGARVVITVDCGTLSFEPLQKAAEAGLDVIVVDHHIGAAEMPKCFALVNPNRLDENSPHRQLAAVGVAFLLCVAVNRMLRARGAAVPDLKQWLDIVALGTVCDVVPLTGVNRALVTQGLKIMAARGNTGIRTLMDIARVDEKPGVYHAGFVLGPRINAGGRVGKSDLGVRVLTTDDEAMALTLAKELDVHNNERRTIEAMVLEAAMKQAETIPSAQAAICVVGNGWHQGVIGIVAGRLKERFYKPSIVIALENGVGKASARSVSGFDMGASVIAARDSGLLLAGGGHAMAAGFTVEENKIPALVEFFSRRIITALGNDGPQKKLYIDAELSLSGATVELVEMLDRLGPFGQSNPAPRVALKRVINLSPEIVKGEHVKTWLIDGVSNARMNAIAFRVVGTKLGEALLATRGKAIDIVGQIRSREWLGNKSVSIMIEDIAQSL